MVSLSIESVHVLLTNETIKSTKQKNINIQHSFNTKIINSLVDVVDKMERCTSGTRLAC